MTIEADLKISDVSALTEVQKEDLAGLLTGASVTNTGTISSAPPTDTTTDYFPADPTQAPFPSPENSALVWYNGSWGGKPYLRDKFGTIWQGVKDSTGKAVVCSNNYGSGGQISANGALSPTNTFFNEVIILQEQAQIAFNGGIQGHFENPASPGAIQEGSWPAPFVTAATPTTPSLPAMPSVPTPSTTAPGSSGTVLTVGAGQTYTTLASAVAAAKAGDTIKVLPGTLLKESVALPVPLLLDGGGTVTGAGTATPSFAGGAILDGSGITDPTGYAHQLGGLVPMVDCIIRGFEVRGFGLQETGSGGTAGIRNGAPGVFEVDSCYIHDNQDGVFSGGFAATWKLSTSWLANNGIGDGLSHNAYFAGGVVDVTINDVTSIVPSQVASAPSPAASYVRASGQAYGGHAIKCRAPSFTATGTNYLASADESCLDLPDGTTQPLAIAGTTFAKGANDGMHAIIQYGEESSGNGYAGGTLTNCPLVALCNSPFIQSMGGTITLTGCTETGNKITAQGGGTVNGL